MLLTLWWCYRYSGNIIVPFFLNFQSSFLSRFVCEKMAALVQGVRSSLALSSCVLRSTLTKSAVVGLQQKCTFSKLTYNKRILHRMVSKLDLLNS